MRPVDRGCIPLDDSDKPKEFSEYKDARWDLIDRLGEYCSYCEMPLNASLAVEHVKPKKHHPDLELQWNNFLLACTNCNSTKSSKDINLDDYYWPDKDNTIRAIEYQEGGIVGANTDLSQEKQDKARATIELTGLNRRPPCNAPAASDRRLRNRRDAWGKAKRSLQNWQRAVQRADSQFMRDMRDQIIISVQAKGFWSVWMTVFRNYPDMRRRFIESFPGTSQECFDDNCNAICRPGGAI